MKGAFITATGTGVGKTWLASALATACVQRGKRVAAIKPIETGVDPDPIDAIEDGIYQCVINRKDENRDSATA